MDYKTINIIIPYFGTFPNYFQLFLNSCKYNNTVDWTIITDNTEKYDYPNNVRVKKMSFLDVQLLIRSKFDFEVAIDSAYKLCDFRPAYGYIFDELIEVYDYWGYGDVDIIYGDIRKFITEDILSYDKVFTFGHLSLIKNTEDLNKLFVCPLDGKMFYREVFSSAASFNFDEEFMGKPNINTIFRNNGYRVWDNSFAADIYTKSTNFILDVGDGKRENKKKSIFVWEKGNLKRIVKDANSVRTEEYLYIHLQKRKMKVHVDSEMSSYKIIPNAFDRLEYSQEKVIEHFDKIKRKHINNQYLRIRVNNLKTKIKLKIKSMN